MKKYFNALNIVCFIVLAVALLNLYFLEVANYKLYVVSTFLVLLNSYLFLKYLSLKNILIRLFYVCLLMGLKIGEFKCGARGKEDVDPTMVLAGGLDDLNFILLFNYLVEISAKLTYVQLLLLLVPFGLFVFDGLGNIAVNAMGPLQESKLLNLIKNQGPLKSDQIILKEIDRSGPKLVDFNVIKNSALVGLLEQNSLKEGKIPVKPESLHERFQKQVIDRSYEVFFKNPLLNNILAADRQELANVQLEPYLNALYLDAVHISEKALMEIVSRSFGLEGSPKFPYVYHSLCLRKILESGMAIDEILGGSRNKFLIAGSDEPLFEQLASHFKNSKVNHYRNLYQLGGNVYYGAQLIKLENLAVKDYVFGRYDVNYVLANGKKGAIELKSYPQLVASRNNETLVKGYRGGFEKLAIEGKLVFVVPEVEKSTEMELKKLEECLKDVKVSSSAQLKVLEKKF